MTKDQIESGRMLASRITTPPGAVILAAQFLRLAEEREALRAALFKVLYDNRPGGGAEDRARAVLDKVGAP